MRDALLPIGPPIGFANAGPSYTMDAEPFTNTLKMDLPPMPPTDATLRSSTGDSPPPNTSDDGQPRPYRPSRSSITLAGLFQILTGCAIFFAIMRYSPLVAIIGTILVVPAVIRTAIAADLHHQYGLEFDWALRIKTFAQSLVMVLMTGGFGAAVFLIVCCVFGLLGLAFGFMMSYGDLSLDAAVVGAAGGMIWGMAAGGLAVFYSILTTWMPKLASNARRRKGASQESRELEQAAVTFGK